MRGRRILYDGTVQPWEVGWTFIQMLALARFPRVPSVYWTGDHARLLPREDR